MTLLQNNDNDKYRETEREAEEQLNKFIENLNLQQQKRIQKITKFLQH